MEQTIVKPAEGKLGIMVVGCGAVATTFMTGVFMARKGLAKPVGSMTQYDKIRIGRGADKKYLHYKDIVPLADLKDIVFGTWDVYPQNACHVCRGAQGEGHQSRARGAGESSAYEGCLRQELRQASRRRQRAGLQDTLGDG